MRINLTLRSKAYDNERYLIVRANEFRLPFAVVRVEADFYEADNTLCDLHSMRSGIGRKFAFKPHVVSSTSAKKLLRCTI